MAYINVNTTGSFVRLDLVATGADFSSNIAAAFAANANVSTVPALQDVTLNATPGLFRWQQLDSASEYVLTTPSTNSVAVTLVLDDTTFFTGTGSTPGLFSLVNSKTLTYFRLYWAGSTTGKKYVEGKGYLSALAPTVNPGSPVWTTPITIEVVGDYVQGTV